MIGHNHAGARLTQAEKDAVGKDVENKVSGRTPARKFTLKGGTIEIHRVDALPEGFENGMGVIKDNADGTTRTIILVNNDKALGHEVKEADFRYRMDQHNLWVKSSGKEGMKAKEGTPARGT